MKTLRIGITGGIGSGKTTVCKIFETLGIPIYYADDRAKALMVENKELIKALVETFGKETYTTSGELNRPYLASIVFNDKEALDKLNAIVHPAVRKDGFDWENQHIETPYTLREAALIYETGMDKLLDFIIVVSAPEALRIDRVIQRDQVTAEAVRDRIDKQLPEKEKLEKADFIIVNDGSQGLIKQILKIHQELKKHQL